MPKSKKIVISCVFLFCILTILSNFTYAIDTDSYLQIYQNKGTESSIFSAGGKILGVIQAVGMAVATIMLVILGIKYILSSADEKAKIKDRAVLYVIGAIIIFAASSIVGLLGNWSRTTINGESISRESSEKITLTREELRAIEEWKKEVEKAIEEGKTFKDLPEIPISLNLPESKRKELNDWIRKRVAEGVNTPTEENKEETRPTPVPAPPNPNE